jgi:hypothetical protein
LAPNDEPSEIALTQLGGTNGVKEGIDDNYMKILIGDIEYTIRPAKFFEGTSHEFVISTQNATYITSDNSNEYVMSKSLGVKLPKELEKLKLIDFSNFSNGQLTNLQIKDVFGSQTQIIKNENGNATIILEASAALSDPSELNLYDPCKGITLTATVLRYKKVLGLNLPNSQTELIIETAINNCTPTKFDYKTDCLNTQCVVDNILADPSISSESTTTTLIKLNYMKALLGMTASEYDWLYSSGSNSNFSTINELYGFIQNGVSLNRCSQESCGVVGGAHEVIKQLQNGMNLSTNERKELINFFALLKCDDSELYNCFRYAQKNPGSNQDLLLNDIKQKVLSNSNALIDGCSNLPAYSARWYELATFEAIKVPAIKTKLKQLGKEYWIQTLENASNVNINLNFWKTAPTVNMDFFGIKITQFPKNYHTANTTDRFTPQEFFDEMRQLFDGKKFMGKDNICYNPPLGGGYFETLDGNEFLNWLDMPLTVVFTIIMADDGNVICSQYDQNNWYWTFSTLNAPGWLEGSSWDGYHPVSGNRRFGLKQNGDGSYTFYVSGVDRLTGWWHRISDGTVVDAFSEADGLWACYLNQIKTFVTEKGGTVSSDFDCTTVRPEWGELKDVLKRGYNGLATTITSFPCKQAEPCD